MKTTTMINATATATTGMGGIQEPLRHLTHGVPILKGKSQASG